MDRLHLFDWPLIEIPFANATGLDKALGGLSSLQKIRSEFRDTFDTQMISGGHHGTLQLANVGLLACLAVARRWNKNKARELVEAFTSAGIGELIDSDEYAAARAETIKAIRDQWAVISAADPIMPMAGIIVAVMTTLMMDSEPIRRVAKRMREINATVDREFGSAIRRFPGQLVRVEGKQALIVVDTGERETLRGVDAGYLAENGISEPGTPFVLHELQFSPDNCASIYIPAVSEAPSPELEAKLLAAETPLPSPAD